MPRGWMSSFADWTTLPPPPEELLREDSEELPSPNPQLPKAFFTAKEAKDLRTTEYAAILERKQEAIRQSKENYRANMQEYWVVQMHEPNEMTRNYTVISHFPDGTSRTTGFVDKKSAQAKVDLMNKKELALQAKNPLKPHYYEYEVFPATLNLVDEKGNRVYKPGKKWTIWSSIGFASHFR